MERFETQLRQGMSELARDVSSSTDDVAHVAGRARRRQNRSRLVAGGLSAVVVAAGLVAVTRSISGVERNEVAVVPAGKEQRAAWQQVSDVGLEVEPTAIAVRGGELWVASPQADGLLRFDAATGEARPGLEPRQSHPKAIGGARALVVHGEHLWALSDASTDDAGGSRAGWIGRVAADGASLDVVAFPEAPAAVTMASDGTTLWTYGAGLLRRLDPASGRALAQHRVDATVGSIAVGGGAVWTGSAETGHVVRLDAATAKPTATVSIGARAGRVPFAVTSDAVWAAGDTALFELDPVTGAIRRRVDVGERVNDIVAVGDVLWVYAEGALRRVEPGAADAKVEAELVGRRIGSIAAAPDAAWVSDAVENRVIQFRRTAAPKDGR